MCISGLVNTAIFAMNEQVIRQSKIYHWVLISLFVICLVFYLSVLFLPILFLILAVSFLLLLLFELATKRNEKNWPSFLCLSWLALAAPTFGIMPMLIAWGLDIFSSHVQTVGDFHRNLAHSGLQPFCPSP